MIDWIGDRLQELHFGSLIVGKISMVINLVVLITALSIKFKFEITGPTLILVGIAGLFLIWIIGFVLNVTGVRKSFMNSQFKDTNMEK